MYDEDQDVDDLDRLLVCPYESSHKVTASRMNHHLVKCRKNYYVTEKTICPFNDEHMIFEQESETHKILCPDRPDNVTDEAQNSDDKRREGNEIVDSVEAEETKAHTNCDSDPQTDKALAETGCINGLKVGGLKDYNIDSTNEDVQGTVMVLNNDESTVNGETESPQENGANDKKCDLEDVSVNAVSHMAGFEPQDDNIAIEKQLSQSKANLCPSLENGDVSDTTVNGHVEEHFDYKKYAPTKEEKEEFLKLIKEHKEEQNGFDDKDESCYQGYIWQGYTYMSQPYHPNQSYPGMYGPGTTFIAYPNGTYHAVNNGQYPPHYAFQPGSGPVPQYIPTPMQGYDYNHGYTPRQHYRRPYRGRNHYHNNHSYNRYHNGYNKHNHYNGHNYNNGHRNHYNHYNGYYNHDAYSHTDTDSNSSASGHSDAGSTDHNMYNGNGHQSDNERPHHQPRRSNHMSKGCVNLERIIHVNTDSDGESGPPSINGNMLDLSPEPSESFEGTGKRKGEKDKVIRKLRKKLNEIYALENKKNSGVQIDCDQLKKLSRKRELEDELAALTID